MTLGAKTRTLSPAFFASGEPCMSPRPTPAGRVPDEIRVRHGLDDRLAALFERLLTPGGLSAADEAYVYRRLTQAVERVEAAAQS